MLWIKKIIHTDKVAEKINFYVEDLCDRSVRLKNEGITSHICYWLLICGTGWSKEVNRNAITTLALVLRFLACFIDRFAWGENPIDRRRM